MSKVTNLNDYRAGKKSPSKVGGGTPIVCSATTPGWRSEERELPGLSAPTVTV